LLSTCRTKVQAYKRFAEVCNEFNQPVGMITKNAGMLRDKDLLTEMAKKNLVSVLVSITSLMKICDV
jgi:DNA repair photolyase